MDYIPLDDEEKALALKQTPVTIINRIDPDSQDRRIRQRQLDNEIYQRQKEKYAKEQQSALEQKERIEKERTDNFLLQKGWMRLPQFREKYYEINSCPFGCSADVAMIAENSPGVSEKDSTDIPYDITENHNDNVLRNTKSFGSSQELQTHLCKDLSGEKLQLVIHYLLKTNMEFRNKLVEYDNKARGYANLASMGPR
jgi:hypothetical protein